jgi:hypothetical protein
VVPAGASCALISSRVTGDVVVSTDANLLLDGSRVDGELTVRDNGFVDSTWSARAT